MLKPFLLAISLLSTTLFPLQAFANSPDSNDSCYMVTTSGRVIDLGGVCQGKTKPTTRTTASTNPLSYSGWETINDLKQKHVAVGVKGTVTNVSSQTFKGEVRYTVVYEDGRSLTTVADGKTFMVLSPGQTRSFSRRFTAQELEVSRGFVAGALKIRLSP